jgi:L-lactate dehydrogenase complex protein LldG
MNSRDTVLGRIRDALADRPVEPLPPVPEVWPETNPDAQTMAARFAEELDAVQGELHRCRSMDDARTKLRGLMEEFGVSEIGAIDRPIAREVTEGLDGVAWVGDDWDPNRIGRLPLGLVAADYLLADTGTCVVANGTSSERLMCYLPPACIVIAATDRLREHLPAAWREIGPRAADPALRGEYVFITGPSRTADIEKILILGVHGPKRLIVLLIEG